MSTLPPNWIETEIGNLAQVVAGGTPQASDETNFAEPGTGVAWLTPADLSGYKHKEIAHGKRDLTKKGLDSSSAKLMPKGAVVFSSRAPIGYVAIAANEICTNQGFKSFVFTEHVHPSYAFYYLKSIKDLADSWGTGTTFKELSGAVAKKLPFKLAPLNEQKRIADKLDSILAKVDCAQARLDKIPGILKRFGQSVLAAATSGELTKEWRKQNGIDRSSWEETVFSELSREITVGFVGKMSDKYQESGIKFLRSQNVRAFKFDPKNLLFISPEFHQEVYKSRLEAGDLAVVRSGAPGTTCVIPSDLGEANCSDLVIVRPNEKLIPEYGCIFMNSSIAQKNVKENQVGVAQQHFNVGSMKLMPINLPTKLEQAEIVRRVHSLFAMADVVEKNYGDSIVKVNKLKQSILSKAFRGELVEQISNDEPAAALLNNIKKMRESKNLSSRKAQAFSIENSLREKITLERKDVMSLTNAPDDYLLGLLNQLGGEASAETLWSKSGLNIDQFYAKLKQEVKRGDVRDDNSSLDPTLRKLKFVVGKD